MAKLPLAGHELSSKWETAYRPAYGDSTEEYRREVYLCSCGATFGTSFNEFPMHCLKALGATIKKGN